MPVQVKSFIQEVTSEFCLQHWYVYEMRFDCIQALPWLFWTKMDKNSIDQLDGVSRVEYLGINFQYSKLRQQLFLNWLNSSIFLNRWRFIWLYAEYARNEQTIFKLISPWLMSPIPLRDGCWHGDMRNFDLLSIPELADSLHRLATLRSALLFERASCARSWSVNTRTNLIGWFLRALFSPFVMS